ncbi:folate-binding protein YgfZ [Subtercola sp. Z020]|uniref:CAF17-like 4Fe-4S cluster assembly/insertion protein YgfZ n=1 Tax=Subtercola sp. Z020 TaxID=2080582 RepID=UPI000CE8CDC5|nr:folate-binding protein YgfZ [Subtercola sp. Z020]PPF88538.1 folate-binding protein YgfZ [Subtercola sp. Z020]
MTPEGPTLESSTPEGPTPEGPTLGRSPFLALPGAVEASGADVGVAAHYGNPLREQRMLAAGALVDLSQRGVISVTGPDRLSWLDSVTSQALKRLSPGESAETLLLDPAGRVEHAIRVFDDGVTAWLLVDAPEAASLVAWLERMRFMLRVEIADRTAEFATVGWMSESLAVADITPSAAVDAFVAAPNDVPLTWIDPWTEVATGGHQYADVDEHPAAEFPWRESLVPRATRPALADAARRGEVEVAGVLAFEALRIAAWRPRFTTEADEKLLPHEVDWIRSAVHLNKGCYRGQETVAKVHNLGHPPRRLVMLHLDGSDAVLPAPGDPVMLEADPEAAVGHITASALHYELGPIALALVRRSTPTDATLAAASEGIVVPAAQEVIVPPEAGAAAGRIPRLPRLGAVRR